jgi:hypothetical protein
MFDKSTIGVLGLWNFDTHDIEASVPQLLDGLKFAFMTSVIAMTVSIFLSVIQAKPGKYKRIKIFILLKRVQIILKKLISNNLQLTKIGVYPPLRNLKL